MKSIWEENGYTKMTEEEKEIFLKFNPDVKETAIAFNVPLKQLVIFINEATHKIHIGRDRKRR